MAYDEVLADRIRSVLSGLGEQVDVSERKMFGGVAFMIADRMACGIVKSDLMVRVGPERFEAALARPHVRPMDFTGRPMRGLVYVSASGIRTAAALKKWIDEAVEVAVSEPPRAPKPARKRAAPPRIRAR